MGLIPITAVQHGILHQEQNMIRRGRAEGWLSLPPSTLQLWADFNGIRSEGVRIEERPQRGCGVIAAKTLDDNASPLMTVPRELVLSFECVEQYAKSDKILRAVLDGLGAFGKVSVTTA